jgi:hypothetical protein
MIEELKLNQNSPQDTQIPSASQNTFLIDYENSTMEVKTLNK